MTPEKCLGYMIFLVIAIALWELGKFMYKKEIADPAKEKEKEISSLNKRANEIEWRLNVMQHVIRDTACQVFDLKRQQVEPKDQIDARVVCDKYEKLGMEKLAEEAKKNEV